MRSAVMTLTASHAALLHVAVQDLHAGKALLIDRLPALARTVSDAALHALIERDCANARQQAMRLAALADLSGGPSNLWMAGILDDAARDAGSHLPGAILDVALIGALRKAKVAEIVSTETALALANRAAPTMVASLASVREEDHAIEDGLAKLLATICGAAPLA